MKHHLFVWGTNPQPFRSKADSSIVLPISVEAVSYTHLTLPTTERV